jgi:hypothetical protein
VFLGSLWLVVDLLEKVGDGGLVVFMFCLIVVCCSSRVCRLGL